MSVQVTCINKSNGNHANPHEAISHFGWYDPSDQKKGKASRLEMVKFLEDGGNAYVLDSHDGSKVYCYVRTSSAGTKFVQTKSNDTYRDNLLSLSECPLFM